MITLRITVVRQVASNDLLLTYVFEHNKLTLILILVIIKPTS